MIMDPFELLISVSKLLWWHIQLGLHTFRVKWYESEVKYLDKRIAELERELADHQPP